MMFGNKYKDGKVLADWFTGPLYCGIGKIVDYDKLFTSSNTSINGYKEHLDSLINWLDLPPIDEKGVRSVVQFSANEDGIIDDVKVIRSGGDIFDREAIRIVKTFPGNVQFYHGKLRRYYFTIPIVFNESTRLSKISKK